MEPNAGNGGLNHYFAKIADKEIYRVQEKQITDRVAVAVNVIEDGGHIHEQHGKDVIEILYVPEEHEKSGQDHTDADVEKDQTANRVEQTNELPSEGNAIRGDKNKKHNKNQAKVNKGLNISGQQKQILRHIDFCKDTSVAHDGPHAALGRVAEKGEDQVSAENIDHIVRRIPAKKLGKYKGHNGKLEQGRENAPRHTQDGALVFLFEIAFDQFLKEKLVS